MDVLKGRQTREVMGLSQPGKIGRRAASMTALFLILRPDEQRRCRPVPGTRPEPEAGLPGQGVQ